MIRRSEPGIIVRCRSGVRYDEEPIAVVKDGRDLGVAEIEDRWYEGAREAGDVTVHYFRLRLVTGETIVVGYRADEDRWVLVPKGHAE